MSLSEICANMVTKKDSEHSKLLDKNALEFITAPWGLALGVNEVPPLYPVQRFILNVYYGLELDGGSNRDIIINDKFNEKQLYRFNEVEYADYLYNEGRLNRRIDKFFPNIIMVVGRRGGKTMLTSCIIAYETYRLLNKFSPQEHYGIMPEDEIRFTCLSTSRETASILYNMVVGHIERSEYFRKFRTKPTSQWLKFRTQRDIDRYGVRGRPSINVRIAPCNAKGLRGPGNMIVGLDEMAFFFTDESSGKKKGAGTGHDDKAVYEAVTPSVAKFKDPVTGEPDGKIIAISSPGPKSGKFYEEFERGFEDDCDDLLVIQAPSWELDPSLSSSYLRNKYKQNPISFRGEFGAQFSDRLFGWIEDAEIVRQCVVPGLKYKSTSMLRVPHFMGIDVGFKNDGTAITVAHWVKEAVHGAQTDRLEVDASDVRYKDISDDADGEEAQEPVIDHVDGEEGREAEQRIKLSYFDPQEIADWIEEFTKRFFVVHGLMDQYYGFSIEPMLIKKGIKQIEYRNFHEGLNSYVYQNLLSLFVGSELRLPEGDPVMVGDRVEKDSVLVRELLTLQAEQRSKYIIRVHEPERKGMHNDLSDSLGRAALLAVEYRNKGYSTSTAASSGRVATMRAQRIRSHSERVKAELNRPSGRFRAQRGVRFGSRFGGRGAMLHR